MRSGDDDKDSDSIEEVSVGASTPEGLSHDEVSAPGFPPPAPLLLPLLRSPGSVERRDGGLVVVVVLAVEGARPMMAGGAEGSEGLGRGFAGEGSGDGVGRPRVCRRRGHAGAGEGVRARFCCGDTVDVDSRRAARASGGCGAGVFDGDGE